MRHYGTDVSLPQLMTSRQRSFLDDFWSRDGALDHWGSVPWTMDPSTLHEGTGMLVRTALNDAVYP